MRYRLLCLPLMLAAFAGCVGAERAVEAPPRWDEGALRVHLRQLVEPIAVADSARAARRTLYAARRLEVAGLMPARDPSFLVGMGTPQRSPVASSAVDPARSHVLGYVTGRHPSYYDELVLVAADLDRPGAAAALEVARRLADEARDTQVPERTVLFALWAPPRTGALGLRDYLANPTWALDGVTRVLLVTTEPSTAAESRQLLEARGIAVDVVAVSDQTVIAAGTQPEVVQAVVLANTTLLTDVLDRRLRAAATAEDSTAAGLVRVE
ncbi:MAG: hypothetical protein ABJF88_07990 [Rhodothermales bacterium]